MPSSASHALIGGLIGATFIAAGADAARFGAVVTKVLRPADSGPPFWVILSAGLAIAAGTYLVADASSGRWASASAPSPR